MRVQFIVHTFDSRALAQLRQAAEDLRRASHQVTGRVTFEAGDAEVFARRAAADELDLVIAAGGDGTVNEVVNGLLSVGHRGGPEAIPRLGIVPLGTANDFAGFLRIPTNVGEAVDTAIASAGFEADVGVLNRRFFINVSTGGLGPEAADHAGGGVKRALGGLAYLVAGAGTFATLRPSSARFVADDRLVHDGDFLLYAVGNGQRAGGGNVLTPGSSLRDGLLDLCIVRSISRAKLLKLLPDLRTGRHLESEHVLYTRFREMRVEATERLVVNADGEPANSADLAYRVVPKAIRLAAPPPESA